MHYATVTLYLCAFACGSASTVERSEDHAPLRATRASQSPKISSHTLPNGLRIVTVARRGLPLATARIVTHRAATREAVAGLSRFTARMLREGTLASSAAEFAHRIERLGTTISDDANLDTVAVSVTVLTPMLDRAIGLLAESARRPAFLPADVARTRARVLTYLRRLSGYGYIIAENRLRAALFGRSHPYANSTWGTEASVSQIDTKALAAYHRRNWKPERIVLIVTGDVEPQHVVAAATKYFGDWHVDSITQALPNRLADERPTTSELVLIDSANVKQVSMAVGARVSSAPPYRRAAAEVFNHIFGATAASRVNMNLREDKGITYRARSHLTVGRLGGVFYVTASVGLENTATALNEIASEFARARRTPCTDTELRAARYSAMLAFGRSIQTSSGMAARFGEVLLGGGVLDDLSTYPSRIRAVTCDDVRDVANELLGSAPLTFVVHGPKDELAPILEKVVPLEAELVGVDEPAP